MVDKIDLNGDIGEGTGYDVSSKDVELMKYVSSVNIACGAHAGNLQIMESTLKAAINKNISVGAHPSYPDKENFGRKSIRLSKEELEQTLHNQIVSLSSMAKNMGVDIKHIKPHGALYNDMAKDFELAFFVATVIKKINPQYILMGLANSASIDAAKAINLPFLQEAFADRGYAKDGFLLPRCAKGSLLEEESDVVSQVLQMVLHGKLKLHSQQSLHLKPDTICVHGDHPKAILFVKSIVDSLRKNGVEIKAL